MNQIRLDNNPIIPEDSVLGFANEEDIDQFLFTRPNVTQLGIQILELKWRIELTLMIAILFHFEDLPSNGSVVRNLNYTLQINQTDSRTHGKLVNHIQYIQLPAQMKIEKALRNL